MKPYQLIYKLNWVYQLSVQQMVTISSAGATRRPYLTGCTSSFNLAANLARQRKSKAAGYTVNGL